MVLTLRSASTGDAGTVIVTAPEGGLGEANWGGGGGGVEVGLFVTWLENDDVIRHSKQILHLQN